MAQQPGYPLPSGELGDDEIVCQLVYLPNRPEYWQAFLSAYHYMTTWRAWERDDDKRGQDAASNWRQAFELTMECWRMTCLDEIETLLRQLIASQCCPTNIFTQQPSGIGPNTGTDIEYGEGDPPDEYGDEPISDWDDWQDYKCEAAYLMVEEVAIKFEDLEHLQATYNAEDVTMEMLGWVISKLSPLLVFVNLAWDVFQALSGIGWELLGDFSNAADEIRNGADYIACAIANADGALDCAGDFESACDEVVSSSFAKLLLTGMPWEAWANIIYTGIATDIEGTEYYLDQFLTPEEHSCCECEGVSFNFVGSEGGFESKGYKTAVLDSAELVDRNLLLFRFNWDGVAYCGDMVEITAASMTPEVNISRIQIKDQSNTVLYDSGDTACALEADELVGRDAAQIYFELRHTLCAAQPFDLELEWE